MSCSQQFYVEEKLRHLITETAVTNSCEVKAWCCISKGSLTISATAAKNAVFPGDVQEAICDISNESECNIKKVELTIKKDFRVHVNGHREGYSRRVATVEHPGLEKGVKETMKFKITIPRNLNPTTNSTLIQSNYRMKIKMVMSGAGDVAVDMPLTVYPVSQQQQMMVPPPAWGIDLSQVQTFNVVIEKASAFSIPRNSSTPSGESRIFG